MTRINQTHGITNFSSKARDGSIAVCGKLITQLQQAKTAVLEEFRDAFATNEHLLRLALNEAEALAWQSGVPQLTFPTLAREKAQSAAAWHARQTSLQRNPFVLALAA